VIKAEENYAVPLVPKPRSGAGHRLLRALRIIR